MDDAGTMVVNRHSVADALSFHGVTKRFGSFAALSDVTVAFRRGEVHCLLGENGAGKSTLCNLAFGIHQADAGEIRLDGAPFRPSGPGDSLKAGIAMVHQHFSLVDDMSVVDNLILGQARGIAWRRAFAAKLEELTTRYGLALKPFARVGDLSIGERQCVEIVKCLIRQPRILILDEPTAVLLPDEIKGLLEVVRRVAVEGCAVILVTHKLAEIRDVADRVTVVRQGRVAAQSQTPGQDIEALVRAMIQRPLEALDPAMAMSLGISAGSEVKRRAARIGPRGPDALQIDAVTVKDATGVVRLDEVTLTIQPGEIVGIVGVEGNGQSELGAVLAGTCPPSAGRIIVGDLDLTGRPPQAFSAAGMGVVPEDRHAVGAITGMTLTENLFLDRSRVPTRFGLLRRRVMREAALTMMAQFDVRASGPDVAFGSLSGGNQQKAVLAREMTRPGLKVLLAAQPTRGLDVGAVEAVYGLIRAASERGVAILLISSELDEVLAIANRVAVLYRGRIVGECRGEPGQRERIGALMAGHSA